MHLISFPFVILTYFIASHTIAQNVTAFDTPETEIEKAQQKLQSKAEVYISFSTHHLEENPDLKQHLSIDYICSEEVKAYCNADAFMRILEYGIEFQLEKAPGEVDFELNMKDVEELLAKDLTEDWDFYPTYESYEALMYQFANEFPDLVKIHNILTLPSDRKLLFAQISSDVEESTQKPRFMYTSTMHGDETAGFVLSLRLIHYLLSNYGELEPITQLVDNMEIWICPNENPDGTYTNDNSTVDGAIRGNANGVDLNRNYPNPVNNPVTEEQLETSAMRGFSDTLDFVASANMHGGIELVNFPFDSWTSSDHSHADHLWWEFTMYEYVDTVREYAPANYMTGMGDGVTHGGDWYVVYGSRQDYFNYYKSTREFTLELSDQKLLDPAELPAHWEYNHRSLINYIRQAGYGITGTVSDMYSGEAIETKVKVLDHDHSNSHVYSSLPYGDFYRPLNEGVYDLKFVAQDYDTLVIENITVANYQTVELDVQMTGQNPFAPPVDLVAYMNNQNSVYLEWESPAVGNDDNHYAFDQPSHYQVFRDGQMLDETSDLYFFEENLTPGTYEYTIKAWYDEQQGLSYPSNTATVTVYEQIAFTIHATSTENGNINPEGDIEVNQGENQTFVLEPFNGFVISDVQIDDNSMGVIDSYTFMNVEADHTIHAVFAPASTETYQLTFNVKDNHGDEITDASITLDGEEHPDGMYHFTDLFSGSYPYVVAHAGFQDEEGVVEVNQADVLKTVVLEPLTTFAQSESVNEKPLLFPNPASATVIIQSEEVIEKLVISDISGRVQLTSVLNTKEYTLDVSHLEKGIYLAGVFTQSGIIHKKLEIIH